MEDTTPNGNAHPGDGPADPGRSGGGKSRRSTSRRMTRRNALKHGVLSETAVLPNENKELGSIAAQASQGQGIQFDEPKTVIKAIREVYGQTKRP